MSIRSLSQGNALEPFHVLNRSSHSHSIQGARACSLSLFLAIIDHHCSNRKRQPLSTIEHVSSKRWFDNLTKWNGKDSQSSRTTDWRRSNRNEGWRPKGNSSNDLPVREWCVIPVNDSLHSRWKRNRLHIPLIFISRCVWTVRRLRN